MIFGLALLGLAVGASRSGAALRAAFRDGQARPTGSTRATSSRSSSGATSGCSATCSSFPDGTFAFPLVGQVNAAGRLPS